MMNLTENERRILDILSRSSPLSKRDLCEQCGIGWATAVKMTARLQSEGYILVQGTERQRSAGKSPLVYSLSHGKPVALGVDIEYGRTRSSIRNLQGEALSELTLSTGSFADAEALSAHLVEVIRRSLGGGKAGAASIEGVGIGIPSHMLGIVAVPYEGIASMISERIGLPVLVDNNIRCFTRAIFRLKTPSRSCLVITIRSGVGAGLVLDGKVYKGENGLSAEIGHITAVEGGAPCRCGKRGCLETLVNRSVLASRCRSELRFTGGSDQEAIDHLFGEAARGELRARRIIDEVSEELAKAIAQVILIADTRDIVVNGAFGAHGGYLEGNLRKFIEPRVYPGLDYSLKFQDLDEEAYLTGAAYLILERFVRS